VNKNYKPLRELDHTHEGSMGNLCNELILEKTERIKEGFDFKKVENAMMNLLK
jgi:argininosuccinate lyase